MWDPKTQAQADLQHQEVSDLIVVIIIILHKEKQFPPYVDSVSYIMGLLKMVTHNI